MAKISARGDREAARWRRRSGWVAGSRRPSGFLVLTERGRLLEKVDGDTTYRVRKPRGQQRRWDMATAAAQAAVLGYERTEVRR